MDFSDIRNYLYNRAEKYWWASLLLGLSVQFVSVISTLAKNPVFTIISSVLLIFVPIIARWFQEVSKDDSFRALKCRLAILYSDAFGNEIPSDISREIKCWIKDKKLSKAPFKRPYYDSKLDYGPNRLADIVSESAFWTYNLARDMRAIMFVYSGVYLLISMLVLYFLFQTNLQLGMIVNLTKVIFSFISLVFTSEAILLIKQYNELYCEAKQLFFTTAKLSKIKKVSSSEVMQTVENYNLILASSPPIPGFLYKSRQNSLNQAYKKVLKNE